MEWRWWARVDPVVRDWWPVVLVAALQQVGVVAGDSGVPVLVTALLGLVASVPLRWRVQRPILVVAVVASATALQVVAASSDPPFGSFVALMIASFSTAAHRGMPAAAAGPVIAMLPAGLLATTSDLPLLDLVFPLVYFGGSWGIGRLVRRQRLTSARLRGLIEALEQERRQNEQLAAEAERHRIARDIHDVVAHSLGVISIQAEAAAAVIDRDAARARRALDIIHATARSSLDEMRGVLGGLRDVDQPREHEVDLTDLVERFRDAGLAATLEIDAPAATPLTVEIQTTLHRLVQEALTNVMRHAHGASATVRVERTDDEVQITVRDDGPGPSSPNGGGFGLLGMRERVTAHGGQLTTSRAPQGGFEVHATIPLPTVPA